MRFMVSTHFVPGDDPSAMVALVPQEQAHIKELMAQGIVEALYIAADRSAVWIVLVGDSLSTIQQTLATFPLYPYMRPEYTPLL